MPAGSSGNTGAEDSTWSGGAKFIFTHIRNFHNSLECPKKKKRKFWKFAFQYCSRPAAINNIEAFTIIALFLGCSSSSTASDRREAHSLRYAYLQELCYEQSNSMGWFLQRFKYFWSVDNVDFRISTSMKKFWKSQLKGWNVKLTS